MGVIQRQSLKESTVAYIGVFIGALSNLYILPRFLDTDEVGLVKTLLAAATLLIPLMQLGSTSLAIRYLPHFKEESKEHHGFLFFLLCLPILGFCFAGGLYLLFYQPIVTYYETKSSLVTPFLLYILPLALCTTYFSVLTAYSRALLRIVFPSFLFNIILKGGLIVLYITYALQNLTLQYLVIGIIGLYGLLTVGMLVYLFQLGQLFIRPSKKTFQSPLFKEVVTYALYIILAGFSGVLVANIDQIMVNSIIGDNASGIYGIVFYMGMVIDIPRRGLTGIVGPVIAQAWKKQDINQIYSLYQKTSILQFIVGLYLLAGIWLCIDEVFTLMPNGEAYSVGKYVVFFIGLTKVIDLLTGVNGEIITFSKYYRFNTYAIPILALLTIGTNLLFIPQYGITGAAIASFLSLSLFNVIKFIFLWYKLQMQPFTWNTLKVLSIGLIAYTIAYLVPITNFALLNILIKGGLLTLIFVPLILWTKASPDINNLVFNFWNRITAKSKR